MTINTPHQRGALKYFSRPLEGDHEVQVATLAVEPFARRRTEQVEALDAVATADLPYLFDPVLY
jgi:hypothetical protein